MNCQMKNNYLERSGFFYIPDLCSSLNCLNGGTCVAQDNEAICNCPISHYGSRCENKVNHCIQGACYNGGVCVSGATSYTCTCPPGK